MDSGTITFLVLGGLAAAGIIVFNLLRLRSTDPYEPYRVDGANGANGADAGMDEADDADDAEDKPEPRSERVRKARQDEPESDERAPQVGAFAPDPSSLPLPSPPDFVGRHSELALLQTAIEDEGATACVVRGRAGSGKTALALQLAAQVATRYPDAQIFLDLQGRKPVRGAAEGLQALVAALSPETEPARQPARLAGQLRVLLTGRRVLLVVDAAPAESGLEHYIPVPGCLLLVTSRDSPSPGGTGVVTETLRELPAEDAREMLQRLAPRAGEQVPVLAELCDGLPLALRLLGLGLADRFDFTSPAACVEAMAAARRGQEAVEAAVQVRWDFLGEEKRRSLAALTVFPQSFDVAAAGAVLGRDAVAAEEDLARLVQGGHLEKLGERYRLPGSVADFADDAFDDAGWEAASERHAEHFARLLGEAGAPGSGQDSKMSFCLFEQEWENFRTAQRWAAARTGENPAAARLCSELGRTAHPWLEAYHPSELMAWTQASLAASRTGGDLAAQGNHLVALGRLYQGASPAGELDRRVILLYEEAISLGRQIPDARLEMEALDHLANVQDDLDRAIEIHEQALALARRSGDDKSAGHYLSSLAGHQAACGESERSMELYQEALELALRSGDREAENLVRWNLALGYEAEGELAPAIEHLEILAGQARQAGDAEAERACREALARLRRSQVEWDEDPDE